MARKKILVPKDTPVRTPAPQEEQDATIQRIKSGCLLLDLALGGGWAEDRVLNVVGDRSTGKTLLAIEMCANFARKHPEGIIRYAETEAAFDEAYAACVGLPIERVSFMEDCLTVEDIFEDMEDIMAKHKGQHVLYVVDSLDALSDRKELARKIDQATMGQDKAKLLSQLFRRLIRPMKRAHMTLLIVSQVRDNIGVTFGRTTKRTGGRALDFYASQVIFLAQLGRILKTYRGIQRAIGVRIRAKVDKNKAGMPFREADFPIVFSYGTDDLRASLEFLKLVGRLDLLGVEDKAVKGTRKDATEDEDEDTKSPIAKHIKRIEALEGKEYRVEARKVNLAVKQAWVDIEDGFRPQRSKY